MPAAKMTFGSDVADFGCGRGPTSQFALDDAEDAAFPV
jgi:hypothetical protein